MYRLSCPATLQRGPVYWYHYRYPNHRSLVFICCCIIIIHIIIIYIYRFGRALCQRTLQEVSCLLRSWPAAVPPVSLPRFVLPKRSRGYSFWDVTLLLGCSPATNYSIIFSSIVFSSVIVVEKITIRRQSEDALTWAGGPANKVTALGGESGGAVVPLDSVERTAAVIR